MVPSLIRSGGALLLLGLSGSAAAQAYSCGGLPPNALGQTIVVQENRGRDEAAGTQVQVLICAERPGCRMLFTVPGGQLRSYGWASPGSLRLGLQSLQAAGLELTINVVQVERTFTSDVSIRAMAAGASGETRLHEAEKCTALAPPEIRTSGD